jgi:Ca2+-binding RTX toxin-like protein
MEGDGGNDALFGEAGPDILSGKNGADLLVGGSGNDWMAGGVGRDVIRARDGRRDRLTGGLDFDRARVDVVDRVREVELFF